MMRLICSFALFTLAVHLYANAGLGYYVDELYLMDCAKRLDFGYVDLTPLVPLMIRLAQTLFGSSLTALRFFPGLAHSITVLLAGLIAKELGGRRFAQALACLCVLIAPSFLRVGSVFVIPSLEPVVWTAAAYLLLLIVKHDRPRLWLPLGVVAAVGLMTKPTMLLLLGGVALALPLTPFRKYYRSRWLWAGVGLALLLVLPNLIWQVQHQWLTAQFVQSVKHSDWVHHISIGEFLFGQVLYLHPINALVWLSGLYYFSLQQDGRPYRLFAWTYLFASALLLAQGSKLYYLIPIYPLFMAAGARQVEVLLPKAHQTKWAGGVLALFALAGIVLAPMGLPLLPVASFERFAATLTLGWINAQEAPELFEMFRDMEGKERELMLGQVAGLYHSLDAAERAETSILAYEYDQAGPLNFFGPKYGLPPPISGNVNYYLWGPRGQHGATTIAVGFEPSYLRARFREVHEVAGSKTLSLCRGPWRPLDQGWGQFRALTTY